MLAYNTSWQLTINSFKGVFIFLMYPLFLPQIQSLFLPRAEETPWVLLKGPSPVSC